MSDSKKMELYKAHQTMQEKLIYFLMTAAGACIGFSLTQAKDLVADTVHVALGVALLLWSISFLMGFGRVQMALGVVWANSELLDVKAGIHPAAGRIAALVHEAEKRLRETMQRQSSNAVRYANWQVSTLILGVLAYVVWQVLLMLHRSP